MMRAFFFALGLFLCLIGAELFLVDRAVLNVRETPRRNGSRWSMARGRTGRQRIVNPPDWAAWAATSAGAVIVLYSIALPKKSAGKG
jgi:hypothetical protein